MVRNKNKNNMKNLKRISNKILMLNEAKLSELQKAYRKYFKKMMKLYGVDSPAEFTDEETEKEFYNNISWYWKAGIGSKENWEEKVTEIIAKRTK